MSRCFPFPPPGYEREHGPVDLALLKEVKLKEKKHKKEKKEKERRKDKDKREKDGSEKQRDKKDQKEKHKDKKEKHRDKKKDKEDRGKDKEKSSISEESTVAGKLEERSGEKLHPKGHINNSSFAEEGKSSSFFQGQNGGKPSQSILPSLATKEAKFVQELDKRIKDNEKARGSQFLERVASVDRRGQEAAAGTALWNLSRVLAEEKSNDRDKRVHIKKMETETRVAKSLNGGTPRSVEEQIDLKLEDKEKYKERGDDKRGDKQKERDKKSHGKDNDKEKEKKKEEKAKLKIQNKKSEHEKSKNAGINNQVVATSNKSANLLSDVDSTAFNEGNIRKRKDMDTNGFLHESEIRRNKVQRLALHQPTENGRKLESSHISSEPSFDKHTVPNNVWLDHRDRLNNGMIEAQKPSTSKPNTYGTNMVGDQFALAPKTQHPDFNNANEVLALPKVKDHTEEAPRKKPPHPDTKYLSQILTVPEVGGWLENDDQEWLFSKKDPPQKPKLELAGVEEEPHAWSEAVHIESADVYALPYVIPY